MRICLALCCLLTAACQPDERSEAPWMGKPVADLVAKVGEPDMLVPGPLMMEAYELHAKYGDYIKGTPYERMVRAPLTSNGQNVYTTYYYDHPALRHMPGRFNGSFNIAVDAEGIIRSYGSGSSPPCRLSQQTFTRWVAGYADPSCIVKEPS